MNTQKGSRKLTRFLNLCKLWMENSRQIYVPEPASPLLSGSAGRQRTWVGIKEKMEHRAMLAAGDDLYPGNSSKGNRSYLSIEAEGSV
jgi:hypothetical protein